jgi:2-polyprenyl-3-methyl-5-hydroxy-6-metoxy-1,4-benzoquinol methylase
MDKKYWDRMAVDYDAEIFSSLANDRDEVIKTAICRFASPDSIVCDFGCGIGKFLPLLSQKFRYVHAIDISDKLLRQARTGCKGLTNISYCKMDLSKAAVKLPKVDFGLCVNVAIMPNLKMRERIFKTIGRHLQKKGHLVLVVPSLESALYTDFRLLQWNLKLGESPADAAWELGQAKNDSISLLRQGIVEIDSVGTKHYLKEEIIASFENTGLDIVSIERVRYSWKTEFENPPKWMREPYPWDWLTVLRKNKN